MKPSHMTETTIKEVFQRATPERAKKIAERAFAVEGLTAQLQYELSILMANNTELRATLKEEALAQAKVGMPTQVERKTIKQGDIVDVNFGFNSGTLSGRRPAVVISGDNYNRITTNLMVAPLSHRTARKDRFYNVPYHARNLVGKKETIDNELQVLGSVCVDQARCVPQAQVALTTVRLEGENLLGDVSDMLFMDAVLDAYKRVLI